MITLVVDRASLSKSTLTIDSEGFGAYCLTPAGYVEPDTTPRTVTVRSAFVHGDLATQSVLDTTDLVLEVLVQGSTSAQLETRAEDLREALCRQLSFTITRTIDGVVKTFSASPATMIRTAAVRKGDVYAHVATYTVSIPVYPIAGTS
jgi:hypothetical protein